MEKEPRKARVDLNLNAETKALAVATAKAREMTLTAYIAQLIRQDTGGGGMTYAVQEDMAPYHTVGREAKEEPVRKARAVLRRRAHS